MEKYVVLDKEVGETPLMAAEKWRAENPQYEGLSLAYAGRLDPMASGKLLVLIGEECKNQTNYHGLDKSYEFSVLFGIESDTQDVLGRLKTCDNQSQSLDASTVEAVLESFVGNITLPYPTFSSKTVHGRPLIVWTLEGRLNEIDIPINRSVVFELNLGRIETIKKTEMVEKALLKVNSIPKVTDPRKTIGNDFRREDVRADWDKILNDSSLPETFTIAHFSCVASTGTYMRTLASEISKKLDSCGLAWSIHRTHIGGYNPETKGWDLEY